MNVLSSIDGHGRVTKLQWDGEFNVDGPIRKAISRRGQKV